MKEKRNPAISLKEAKKLLSLWAKASFPNRAATVRYHAAKHGGGGVWKYLRRAAAFRKSRARRTRRRDGSVRYLRSNGEFLITQGGKIVTYGVN